MLARPRFGQTIALKSSLVKSVQYDLATQVMDVKLCGGNRYRYRGVDGDLFSYLVTAKSPGKVFNEIKAEGFYKSRKLPRK